MFRQIGGPLLFFTFVLTGVVWLSQSLRMLDLVINQSQSALTYLYLTLLALPQLMALILPFALFCAVLYALNRLYVESELVVIWAAGFSRWAVAGPVLVIAVAATIVGYLFNLVVMPAGMREMKDRVFEIRADLVNTFVREGAFTNPIAGLTVYVGENNGRRHSRHPGARRAQSESASRPIWRERGLLANTPEGPRLIMYKGNVQWLEGGEGRLKILNFEKYTFDLGAFDKQRDHDAREASERYLSELLNPEKTVNEKQRRKFYSEAHNRLSGAALLHRLRADRRHGARRRQFQPPRLWRAYRARHGRRARRRGCRASPFSRLTNATPDAAVLMYVVAAPVDRRIVVPALVPGALRCSPAAACRPTPAPAQ